MASDNSALLDVEDVVKYFPVGGRGGFTRESEQVQAVDGVSFSVKRGETLGLVGESGCGKSTLARLVTALHPVTSGHIRFKGQDITSLSRRQMRPLRRSIQMVFQDPYGSLNPRRRVGSILADPYAVHGTSTNTEVKRNVQDLMERVGLSPEHYNRFPSEFSGGQRQRIGIARALALNPELIICDEPVSALDVSIQAQIINLLEDLQDEFGLTYVFIAHDLSVVRHVSDRLAVMYLGKLVETGPVEEIYTDLVIRIRPRCSPLCQWPIGPSAGLASSVSSSPGTCPRRFDHPRAVGSIHGARRLRRVAPSKNRCSNRNPVTPMGISRHVISLSRAVNRWPKLQEEPVAVTASSGEPEVIEL